MKFDHIGIFAQDLRVGKKILSEIFKVTSTSKVIYDKNLNVKILFLSDEKVTKYEIVAPFRKKNPVDKILKENKNILNHIAYQSNNFDYDLKKLRKKGFAPLTKALPAKAFNNKRVCFFYTPLKFIIEVIEVD